MDSNDEPLPSQPKVPTAVVNRLSLYLRELQQLVARGVERTNSSELGTLLGFSDAKVRKDLAHFGQFGYPGKGYLCKELISVIQVILGADRRWPVAIVGIGNLGQALLGYKGFSEHGFQVVAAFDNDVQKINRSIEGVPVYDFADLETIVKENGIQLGIIAVPAQAAQSVADRLVESGIVGVLNFAQVTISLPPKVHTVAVDLAIQLQQLAFSVMKQSDC